MCLRVVGLQCKPVSFCHQFFLERNHLLINYHSNACYHSSLILLLSSAQHLVLGAGAYQELVLQDLSHVQVCLEVLQFCEEYDIAAMRLVDIIGPLYQRSCDAAGQSGAVSSLDKMHPTTDINGNCEVKMQLGHIIYQSVAAMSLACQEIWV